MIWRWDSLTKAADEFEGEVYSEEGKADEINVPHCFVRGRGVELVLYRDGLR